VRVERRRSTAPGRGLVLSDKARPDPATLTDRDSLPHGPSADTGAALTANRGPRTPARLPSANPAGALHERGKPRTEPRRVLIAQVNLILSSADPKPHGLIRRPAIKIIFQGNADPLCRQQIRPLPGTRNAAQAVTDGSQTLGPVAGSLVPTPI